VAERLAMFVNEIYRNPSDTPGLPVGLAMVAFTFQLYSDFSGYTDMALGVGKLFGLELTPNFDRPFAATNIQDFWRRWHMSFSRWIGDYIFLPLRMSWRRGGKLGLLAAIMVTFFLVGVWHGTGWAFAIFGLVQGIYMAGSTFTLAARNKFWETRGQRDKLWLVTSRRVTTFAMVTLSLVFFRANTIPDAFGILKCVFAPMNLQTEWLGYTARASLRLAVVTVAAMETAEYFFRDTAVPFARLLARPLWQRWTVYILVLLGIVVGGVFASAQRFIYNAF
jgi:D-alanyl-lipoteichoic acid acyltransferase DltB (MBOAT superfamily)